VQQIHRIVEPREVEPTVGGLDPGSGEDRERNDGDAGLAHAPDVVVHTSRGHCSGL